jgi:hypothetical protein
VCAFLAARGPHAAFFEPEIIESLCHILLFHEWMASQKQRRDALFHMAMQKTEDERRKGLRTATHLLSRFYFLPTRSDRRR